jgi:hypothetical protein
VGVFSYPQGHCWQWVGDLGVRACRSVVKVVAGFVGAIRSSFHLPPSLGGGA